MSKLDLNNPLDFARLTLGNVGALIQDFAGRDPTQWDLLEGSYNNIKFHVFTDTSEYQAALATVTDSYGRRKIKYKFPYVDGQTTDDLGRAPSTYSFDILLHGQRYLIGFQKLITEFNKPTPGTLIHPVLGKIVVAVETWEIVHTNEKRQAMMLKVFFTEHNFTIADFTKLKVADKSVKSSLVKALEAFQKIEAALVNVEGAVTLVRTVKNRILQNLDIYNTSYGTTLTKMNRAFNNNSNTDIPSLLPVNEGGTRNPDGSTISDQFPIVRSINDPFNTLPIDALQQPIASVITVQQLYKDLLNLRDSVTSIINDIKDNGAALELYDDILNLRQTAISMQEVFERGSASSQAQVVEYITPRLMTLREVAFANALNPNRVEDLDLLNPELESINYIPKATSVKVPIS